MNFAARKILFAITLCFLLVPAALWAQVPGEDWTRIAVFGGNARSVAVSPNYSHDDTLFVGVAGGGVWRSNDRGHSWTHSLSSSILAYKTVADIAVSPYFAYDGTVFALTSDGRLYRSTNAGAGGSFTFSYRGSIGSNGTQLAISPDFHSDGTVFAAGVGVGLWYSTDGGGTLQADGQSTERFSDVYALAISPDFANDQTLYVGGEDSKYTACFRRVGYGSSQWYDAYTGLGQGAGERVTALVVKDADPHTVFAGTLTNGMWVTANSGANWHAACDGDVTNPVPEVGALAYHSASLGDLLLEGRHDGLRDSNDDGSSCAADFPFSEVTDIAFEPDWDARYECDIYVATPFGLFKKSCHSNTGGGPVSLNGSAVALAPADSNGPTAAWLGSGRGLLKSYHNDRSMVQYNNFPNGEIPEIIDICLDPNYDEDGTCGTDDAILFVAANFPGSPSDNGVYKSTDFGNSWMKLVGGDWPTTADPSMNDLAISPSYAEGTTDTTLYAATTIGLYRWDGSNGWRDVNKETSDNVQCVAVPPTYDRGSSNDFPEHTVFMADEDGLYYSKYNGDGWTKTGYPQLSSSYEVTGIAFPGDFGPGDQLVYVSSNYYSQNIYLSGGPEPWLANTWAASNNGLPTRGVLSLAAAPKLGVDNNRMLCATTAGAYYSTDRGSNWTASFSFPPALAVTFEPTRTDGKYAMVGLTGKGAAFDSTGGENFDEAYVGFGTLPNDVWATAPHERDPCVIFAASPSYGVFVSEDKGASFRPWNRGKGGSLGPCVIRHAYGINMLANRRGTDRDAVWVGTADDGLKVMYTYYDSATQTIDLETEDGTAPNGWRNCKWYGTTTVIPGKWERIEVQPGTGQTYPVWATGQTTDGGFAELLPGGWFISWKQQNSGLSGGAIGKGVRLGYDSVDPAPLASGNEVYGDVAQSNWDYYYIDFPGGDSDLHCFLDDPDDSGPEDADMYIRFGSKPTTSSWDYRPWVNGDEDVCIKGDPFTLLTEDFEGSWGPYGDNPPTGWTVPFRGSENPNVWNHNDWYNLEYDTSNYYHVAKVSYTPHEDNQNEGLLSPAMDVPAGATSLILDFDQRFYDRGGDSAGDVGEIFYRSDRHTSWTFLYSVFSTGTSHQTLDIGASIPDFAGDTNVQILFYYYMQPADTNYGYWWIDNVTVTGKAINVGRWYIGVNGYGSGNNAYGLTATLNSGCAASPIAPHTPRKAPARSTSSSPTPKAPSGTTIWGTVNAQGVAKGTDSGGTTTWSMTAAQPANTNAQTILELSDLQIIVGCDGNVYYSPAPDEGATTWIDATPNVADAGSNDFTDLIQASNGDVLISADGTGTGTLAGGVWLSGDEGAHWMKISSGFDSDSQALSDIMVDSSDPPQYYSSTRETGVFTRTITASPYPTVSSISPDSGPIEGGTTVTVTGTGFSNSCPTGSSSDCPDSSPVVLLGDTEVSATYVSSIQLSFVTPGGSAPDYFSVKVRNPDTRLSTAGPNFHYLCSIPSVMSNNGASDLDAYADTGVQVTWSAPSEWGDGGSGTRYFVVYRGSTNASGALSSSTHQWTDTGGANGVTYTYTVRAYNGCGSYTTTAGASASDDFNVPEEVPNGPPVPVTWDSGTQMSWDTATGATGYRVYRGEPSALPDLQGTGASVCQGYEGGDPTTGATLSAEPAPGKFYWYLVEPYNGAGEGTVGASRSLSSTGDCASP